MSPPPSLTHGKAKWSTLVHFLHYLWPEGKSKLKIRLVSAIIALMLSKVASVYVPVFYRDVINYFDKTENFSLLTIPFWLIISYGLVRIMMSLFAELRDVFFSVISQSIIRLLGRETFTHMHKLSLRFHLDKKTGALNRSIDRGMKGIEWLLFFSTMNLIPNLLEILLITGVVAYFFGFAMSMLVFTPLVLFIIATIIITEWRNKYRRDMNEHETESSAKAVDSLINYETVKYFGNETLEAERFDSSLAKYERAAVLSQRSLSILNLSQNIIMAIGFVGVMVLAGAKLLAHEITMGDFVMINTYLMQIFMPLNFLGVVYRTILQSLIDLEGMMSLLNVPVEVKDKENAPSLRVQGGQIEFQHVHFAYNPDRKILKDISFIVKPGQSLALVGTTGAGKSTISRLLFRFYDVTSGTILIDGQDIRTVDQASLRAAFGIVPQDTVLFNDTLYYNIAYGNFEASDWEVKRAAELAHIAHFIESLPQGYDTLVGERGLKLSGGEKQRVAIARVLLKNPKILIFDEATSALDSHTEKEIQKNLREISEGVTTLMIAHRLSTIVDADQILVLEQGEICEAGTHRELIEKGGAYASMWARQQETQELQKALEKVDEN